MTSLYPKWKFHAIEEPRQVRSADEEGKLGPDWSDTYIYHEYPKRIYSADGTSTVVNNPDEESALAGDAPRKTASKK